MSYVVLVVLSLLWLGFFLPGLLQTRRSSPFVSATDFKESLTRISTGVAVEPPAAGVAPAVARPRRSRREIARRRDTLLGLCAAVVAGLALGLSFGGLLRLLAVPPALALVAYIAMLRMEVANSSARPLARPVQPRPAVEPASTVVVVDDGVVPSVRRRPVTPDEAAELERLAG